MQSKLQGSDLYNRFVDAQTPTLTTHSDDYSMSILIGARNSNRVAIFPLQDTTLEIDNRHHHIVHENWSDVDETLLCKYPNVHDLNGDLFFTHADRNGFTDTSADQCIAYRCLTAQRGFA
jgi:hypothetical protein